MITPIENEVTKLFSKLYNGVPHHERWKVCEAVHTLHTMLHPRAAKQCSCGRIYTVENWYNLPLVGYQSHVLVGGEMRNCPCSSTILFVGRRGQLVQPKARILSHTIIDPSSVKTRPPFSLLECMNITQAFQSMRMPLFFDQWTDRQLLEAANEGKPPSWMVDERGNNHAVY